MPLMWKPDLTSQKIRHLFKKKPFWEKNTFLEQYVQYLQLPPLDIQWHHNAILSGRISRTILNRTLSHILTADPQLSCHRNFWNRIKSYHLSHLTKTREIVYSMLLSWTAKKYPLRRGLNLALKMTTSFLPPSPIPSLQEVRSIPGIFQ